MATDGNSCWSKYGRDSLQQCRRGCFVMYDAEFSFKKKLYPVVSLLVLTVSKRKWYIVWWHCSKLYSQCNVKTTRTTSHQMLSSVWTSRFSRDSSDHLRSSWSSSSSAMPLSGELVMAARTDWTVTVCCHRSLMRLPRCAPSTAEKALAPLHATFYRLPQLHCFPHFAHFCQFIHEDPRMQIILQYCIPLQQTRFTAWNLLKIVSLPDKFEFFLMWI